MNRLLKSNCGNHKYLEIHFRYDESTFEVGSVIMVAEDGIIVSSITPEGYYDGYRYIREEDIILIRENSNYLKKVVQKDSNVANKKDITTIGVDIRKNNCLVAFLTYSKKENKTVAFKIGNNREDTLVGKVIECESGRVCVNAVDCYGNNDGKAYFALSDIRTCYIDRIDEQYLDACSVDDLP